MGRRGPKPRNGVKQFNVWLPEELIREFRELIALKYRSVERGLLSWEVEQALRNWIALHKAGSTEEQMIPPNPRVDIFKVFLQVKQWMETELGCDLEKGAHISINLLRKAISAVRGSHPKTVRRWLKLFHEFGLIKPISAGVWELL